MTFGSGGRRSIQLSYERVVYRGRRISRVLFRLATERIISLGPPLPSASCSLPGTGSGAGNSSSLLGLAPGGVYRATPVTRSAVRSYRTVSPLPVPPRGPSAVCSLLHFPSPRDARPLAGTLPCGARTFLDGSKPAAILTRLPNCQTQQCPGEDSNLHAISGTRSLVWPVYQFQHLGITFDKSRSSALLLLPAPCGVELLRLSRGSSRALIYTISLRRRLRLPTRCSREDSNLHRLAPTRS